MPATARRVLIFQFLDDCEKGFGAKVIRDWLRFSTQTRQPGWGCPLRPGSAFHAYRPLSWGLSRVNLLPHWSFPFPGRTEAKLCKHGGQRQTRAQSLSHQGPPGQDGLNKDALTRWELTFSHLFASNYNPSSLPHNLEPTTQTSFFTSYGLCIFSFPGRTHTNHSTVQILMWTLLLTSPFHKTYCVPRMYIQHLI